MSRKTFFIGFLMLSLVGFMGTSWTQAATTYDVEMGKLAPPCGPAGTTDIGFVDCTSSTGGVVTTAITTIMVGDSVKWTMGAPPHTATSSLTASGGPLGP